MPASRTPGCGAAAQRHPGGGPATPSGRGSSPIRPDQPPRRRADASLRPTLRAAMLSWEAGQPGRRGVLGGGALLGLAPLLRSPGPGGAAPIPAPSVDFVNARQGYRLQHPATWEETTKAGADVLFRDRDNKGAEVGVTVSPVRVKSLEQFADVETAGSRLLQAESAKESTQSVAMLHESARRGRSGTLIYDFDYDLDTTRGRKRVLCSVAISNQKLYIVNGSIKAPKAPGAAEEDTQVVDTVRTMVDSFDVLI